MFQAVGNAIKPAVDWIKRFFTPIQTDGAKALEWGKKFGNGLAEIIKRLIDAGKWAGKLVTLGGRIHLGGSSKDKAVVDGSHANGLNYVPFDGYRAELHKGESVLTASESQKWRKIKNYNSSSNSTSTLNFAPVINISGNADEVVILKALKKYKREIYQMLMALEKREAVRVYG